MKGLAKVKETFFEQRVDKFIEELTDNQKVVTQLTQH